MEGGSYAGEGERVEVRRLGGLEGDGEESGGLVEGVLGLVESREEGIFQNNVHIRHQAGR
jgi:hypothetical protein